MFFTMALVFSTFVIFVTCLSLCFLSSSADFAASFSAFRFLYASFSSAPACDGEKSSLPSGASLFFGHEVELWSLVLNLDFALSIAN